MNTFCVNALGNSTGTSTETLGPRPAKWPALRFVERGEPVDLSAGFARSHQPMRAFQQRAQTCEASLGIPRPRFFASFASVMCLHQVVQRHSWLFPLQGKFLFVAPAFLPLARPSESLGFPFLFNRWLFSTEVWYNAQPLAKDAQSLAFGQASVVSVHSVQSLLLRSTGRSSFYFVPLGARFHVVLRVGGMPSVCLVLVVTSSCSSYGFFETMAYSCNPPCPIVSWRVTPQALRKANWGGEPCH